MTITPVPPLVVNHSASLPRISTTPAPSLHEIREL